MEAKRGSMLLCSRSVSCAGTVEGPGYMLDAGPSRWKLRLQLGQAVEAQVALNPNFPQRDATHAKVQTVVISNVSYQ